MMRACLGARGLLVLITKQMIQQVPKPDHKIGMHRRHFTRVSVRSDGPIVRTGTEGKQGRRHPLQGRHSNMTGGSDWPPSTGIPAIRCLKQFLSPATSTRAGGSKRNPAMRELYIKFMY